MPIDITRIRVLCFDVDGTLSDTDDQFMQRLVDLISPIRFLFMNHDPYPFARRMVMALENPGNFLLGIPDRLSIDDKIAAIGDAIYRKGFGQKSKPFLLIDGVRDMLEVLHPHYKMAIVSARGQRTTNRFLEQYELSPFFHHIVTAQTCNKTKPYPDPILWAAKQMNVHPSECAMIGDTTIDIRAGIAAGAQTIGVLCGFGEYDELSQAGANLILTSTPEIVDYLMEKIT